jgi:hypothetical protein
MEPTNEDRVKRIDHTMIEYVAMRDKCYRTAEYDEDDVRDLVADLRHWCRANDIDFEYNFTMAQMNFDAEVDDEKNAA